MKWLNTGNHKRSIMKKMISIVGAVFALVGSAYAASATVMSFEGGKYVKGEMPPAGWFDFSDGTGASTKMSTTTTARQLIATVKKGTNTTAGFGFNWHSDDADMDLSAYKGLCLTYKSTDGFRVDLKQSTIEDYNFNGFMVGKHATYDTLFVAFEDATQEEGWGEEVPLDLKKMAGVQFSYKGSFASGTSNIIEIAAISLGSSCSNHAPTLQAGVTSPATETLNEGDTLNIGFKDIFEDADDDNLSITMDVSGYIVDISGKKSYTMSDIASVKSKGNPTGANTTGTVTFTATDPAGKSVSYVIDLTLVDRQNAPLAKTHTYEMNEDTVLTVNSTKGLLVGCTDEDGDVVTLVSHTLPTNGTLEVSSSNTGAFSYTPNKDFFGKDTFTYTITDGNEKSVGTVIINVKNVNDPVVVEVKDSTIFVNDTESEGIKISDGITVEEDFAAFDLLIPLESVVFTDPDAEDASVDLKVKSKNGKVAVSYAPLGGNHVIAVSPVADANESDVIMLYVADGKDTVGVSIPVTITPVADPPKAFNDSFTVVQDSVNAIDAKHGVLANDVNPDGKAALKAVLVEEAMYGAVTLDSTGAFTYAATEYEGEDGFTYVVVNAEGDTSAPAMVFLNVVYKNKAPTVVAGVLDTVGNRLVKAEDFGSSVTFKGTEVKSWFVDVEGDSMTFAIDNKDSLVSATMNSAYAITVKSVRDACGEGSLGIVATDVKGASTTLEIPVSIECKNDSPARIGGATDTVYNQPGGWREAIYVFDIFSDPDDTVLVMKVTAVDKVLNAVVEGDSLIVTLANETQFMQDKVPYPIKVVATDESGASSVAKTLVFMVGEKVSIPAVTLASPKATWQNAILADRGVAAIFDMQGRVMWKHALPVSEAQVRNAAAKVQGRKILMVNKQTWTIR